MRWAFTGVIVFPWPVSSACACGTGRWSVKVSTDQDASNVKNEPRPITIANLVAIQPSAQPANQSVSRFVPAELTTYQINGN
jgi:hypothetical protein